MIKGSEDINYEEWEAKLVSLNNNFNSYMINYVIPEVFAFELANAHYRDWSKVSILEQHYKSMCDVFNGFHDSLMDIAEDTSELLKIKYNLVIIDDSPIKIEKRQ